MFLQATAASHYQISRPAQWQVFLCRKSGCWRCRQNLAIFRFVILLNGAPKILDRYHYAEYLACALSPVLFNKPLSTAVFKCRLAVAVDKPL